MKKVNNEISSFAFSFYRMLRFDSFDLQSHHNLNDFEKSFRFILRKHLEVFTFWSIFNCAVGLGVLFFLKGSSYYFCMMSCVWGVINFFVAFVFFCHTLYRKSGKVTYDERLSVQRHTQRMMLLNIGIDVAYIIAGFELRKYSFIGNIVYPDLWLGFGWAIVIQGLFLLIQDIAFLGLYRNNYRKEKLFFEKLMFIK